MIEINKQDYELAISDANHSQSLTMFEKLKEENLALKAQVVHLNSLLEQSIPHIHSRKAKGKASYDFLVSVQRTVSKLRQQAKESEL